MPIYDFKCRKCGEKFSELCHREWQGSIFCPICQTTELEQQLSVFAAHTNAGSTDCRDNCPAHGCCGGCAGRQK